MEYSLELLKQSLKKSNNIEAIKEMCVLLASQNERMQEMIDEHKAEEARKLEQLKLFAKDKLSILKKVLFARSSEKTSDRVREKEQDTKFTLHAEDIAPPPPKDKEVLDLPQKEVIHESSQGELKEVALEYGYADESEYKWEELKGLYESATEITVHERVYEKILHKRKKYKLIPKKESVDESKQIIHTAENLDKILKGSGYSIDFCVMVALDKYLNHMPYERQRREMVRLGLNGVSVKTLSTLACAVVAHQEFIIPQILKDILEQNLAPNCDETPWPIQDKKTDDGYMWCVSNQAGSYYRFEPTRSGKVIKEIIENENYNGAVISDGYSGYNRLKELTDVKVAYCWAHARRKFTDIKENYPQECNEILEIISKLFEVEKKAKDWEELKKLREEKSKEITKDIYTWLLRNKENHLYESTFTKAINYSLNHWKGLTLFIEDVSIPLTTNDAERALRSCVLGRKNFYGSKTINGADTAADLYTVIETCKKAQLDPAHYIKYVIRENNHNRKPLSPLKYAIKIRSG